MTKEKPILFSTPMVQALLNTKPGVWPAEPIAPEKPFKSQTRRVVKPQPDDYGINGVTVEGFQTALDQADEYWLNTEEGESVQVKPRYNVGDILWVRETWQPHPNPDGYCGHCSMCKRFKGKYIYRASYLDKQGIEHAPCCYWKPSIFMPREAARLFLKVKSVRLERVQVISHMDARSEGVNPYHYGVGGESYIKPFIKLWDTINAKRGYSWEGNPWVFVYEFMRIEE